MASHLHLEVVEAKGAPIARFVSRDTLAAGRGGKGRSDSGNGVLREKIVLALALLPITHQPTQTATLRALSVPPSGTALRIRLH